MRNETKNGVRMYTILHPDSIEIFWAYFPKVVQWVMRKNGGVVSHFLVEGDNLHLPFAV